MRKIFIILLLLYTSVEAASITHTNALDAFNKGNYEEAYTMYESLFFEDLTNEKVNFQLGRSAFETKRFDEAVAAFERVLIRNEKHHLARLELARTYFVLALYEQSEDEFNRVLKTPSVPNDVKKTVQLYIGKIEELKQKHTFTGFYTFGIEDDDNINNGNDLIALIGPKVRDTAIINQIHLSDMYKKRGRYTFEHTFGFYAKNYLNNPVNNFVYSYLSSGPRVSSDKYHFYLPITLSALNYGNTPASYESFFFPEQKALSFQMPSQKVFNSVSLKFEATRKKPSILFDHKIENITHYVEKMSTLFNTSLALGARSFKSDMIGMHMSMKGEKLLYYADLSYKMDRKYSPGRVDIDQDQWSGLLNITKKLDLNNAFLNMGINAIERQYLDLQTTFDMRSDHYLKLYASPTFILDKKSKIVMDVSFIRNRSTVPVYTYEKRSFTVSYSYSFDNKQIKSMFKRVTK